MAKRIRVIRFPMPYDETDTARPGEEAYRRRQTDHVHAHLAALKERQPDLIRVGREGFVWGIPELAARAAIPCAVLCHGTILYLLSGMYPEPLGSRFLAELRKADLIICCARGLSDRFRFVGWVDRGLMPQFLALGDMLLMPSASEGMSLACLEAMACGRLVIASDIPGAREIIAHGATGLLFRMGDVEELTAKMLVATGDPELRARLGRAARAHVERHHRRDLMVARYAAAFEELVERCGRARPSAVPVSPGYGRRQITG